MGLAMELMRQERGLSTQELAERVGYASEDSFTRAFRRTTGQIPSAWRREH
jgi:AraC-like DNA-binding protein